MAPPDHDPTGDSAGPMEDELDQAVDRLLDEGVQRLHRPWRIVLVTGFVGGTEVALGVLALLAVREETGSQLLAGLAFSIGFVALLLGRSELFTEGFLVPVTTVVAKRASVAQLAKLWSGTLAMNLIGGWVMMGLITTAFVDLRDRTVTAAAHFVEAPLSAETISLSVLGGATITLMTRMQHGTDSTVAKIVAAVVGAFLLAGLEMFHSVLDSLLIFGALHTGDTPFGYLDFLRWFAYTVTGNIIGGVGLVTVLRLIRSAERIEDERHDVEADSA
jgi:formate/nitrite transporter FocA (FNT family)